MADSTPEQAQEHNNNSDDEDKENLNESARQVINGCLKTDFDLANKAITLSSTLKNCLEELAAFEAELLLFKQERDMAQKRVVELVGDKDPLVSLINDSSSLKKEQSMLEKKLDQTSKSCTKLKNVLSDSASPPTPDKQSEKKVTIAANTTTSATSPTHAELSRRLSNAGDARLSSPEQAQNPQMYQDFEQVSALLKEQEKIQTEYFNRIQRLSVVLGNSNTSDKQE